MAALTIERGTIVMGISQFRQLLAVVLSFGFDPKVSRSQQKKIRATNALCLILGTVTLPYAPIFWLMGAKALGAVVVPIALSYIGIAWLNRRHWYYAARLALVTIFNCAVVTYAAAFGLPSGIHYLFFPLACLALILFERSDRKCIAWAALLPLGLDLTLVINRAQPFFPLPEAAQTSIQVLLIPTTFFILLASVYYLQTGNEAAELELRSIIVARQAEMNQSHQIFDAITDMIILKGKSSNLIWGNKAFRDYYDMAAEQMSGVADASPAVADLTQQYVRDDMQVLRSGQALVIPAEQVISHDGSIGWFNTVKAPIFDARGEAIMLVAVCRNITKQREIEQTIVDQRLQMIATAKLSALGEMAGGIAHEVNNPLAIISGRVSNIRRLIQTEGSIDKDRVQVFMNDIYQMTERIAKIIHGLRSFSRSGEEDPYEMAPLKGIIDDTLALCGSRLKEHGIIVTVTEINKDIQLSCRAVQISQILLNLLANSCDAVESCSDKWIDIRINRRERGTEIKVVDSGPGIAAEHLGKIFQPFFTSKPIGKGTGLGLSISLAIAADHGGQFYVDTAAVHTTFVLWLPDRDADQYREGGAARC